MVESDYGWHIITCTDEFVVPDEITSIEQLPQEFIDTYREAAEQQAQQEAYQTWFDEFKENADIVINDMPEGLPYAVDMSQYQTASDDSTGENASDSSSTESSDEEGTSADESSDSAESADQTAESDGSVDVDTTEGSSGGEQTDEAA